MDSSDVREIASQLRRSGNGAAVGEPTLMRLIAEEIAKRGSRKEVCKAVKRKLHQICGAFVADRAIRAASELLDGLESGADLENTCRTILTLHVSTAERLADYPAFYGDLFALTGPTPSVLDIGCGFHPFSIPWMPFRPAAYRAYEVDERIVRLLNRFFVRLGYGPSTASDDCLICPPSDPVDLAFLLKLLPTLEQQKKGAGLALLRAVPARWAVVSVATQTLCQRSKGMRAHYERVFGSSIADEYPAVHQLDYGNELVWVVQKAL